MGQHTLKAAWELYNRNWKNKKLGTRGSPKGEPGTYENPLQVHDLSTGFFTPARFRTRGNCKHRGTFRGMFPRQGKEE